MDPIFEAAKRKRDELVQELDKLNVFLETYQSLAVELQLDDANKAGTDTLSTGIDSGGDKTGTVAEREAEAADATPPKRVRVRDNPKPTDVVAAAVALIRETGRPMTRREIHTALKERGMEVKGADPIKALGTMLWRSGEDRLVQLEGLGYWPKEDQYHPAGYYPDIWRRAGIANVQHPLGLNLEVDPQGDAASAEAEDEYGGL